MVGLSISCSFLSRLYVVISPSCQYIQFQTSFSQQRFHTNLIQRPEHPTTSDAQQCKQGEYPKRMAPTYACDQRLEETHVGYNITLMYTTDFIRNIVRLMSNSIRRPTCSSGCRSGKDCDLYCDIIFSCILLISCLTNSSHLIAGSDTLVVATQFI